MFTLLKGELILFITSRLFSNYSSRATFIIFKADSDLSNMKLINASILMEIRDKIDALSFELAESGIHHCLRCIVEDGRVLISPLNHSFAGLAEALNL